MTREPAKNPCGSCPYRQDVPSGIWHEEEYVKLPQYDKPMIEQPVGMFGCHQANGRLCSGWVATHDMYDNLALRVNARHLTDEVLEKTLTYTTTVPLFASGQEAHDHGMRDYEHPPAAASKVIEKLERKRA